MVNPPFHFIYPFALREIMQKSRTESPPCVELHPLIMCRSFRTDLQPRTIWFWTIRESHRTCLGQTSIITGGYSYHIEQLCTMMKTTIYNHQINHDDLPLKPPFIIVMFPSVNQTWRAGNSIPLHQKGILSQLLSITIPIIYLLPSINPRVFQTYYTVNP